MVLKVGLGLVKLKENKSHYGNLESEVNYVAMMFFLQINLFVLGRISN